MSIEKVRENRLRRMANRQNLRLMKSRRRDPRALDYGCYWLVDNYNHVEYGAGPNGQQATLDEIEDYLTSDRLR